MIPNLCQPKLGLIGNTASQNEAAIAIAAVGKALIGIDFQPNAGMTKRSIGQAIASAVTSDTAFWGADGFGLGCAVGCHNLCP